MRRKYILSCEHAGNKIPDSYRPLFRNADEVLQSHRGWDPGSLEMGRAVAEKTGLNLHYTETSRLLVEANRSLGNVNLFSEFSNNLPAQEKKFILDNFYRSYRGGIEDEVRANKEEGLKSFHISIHTFTPELNGETRDADIGLLFDPSRPPEVEFCGKLAAELQAHAPKLLVRDNYPYKGTDDGLTSYFRKKYSARWYSGIEIEINQKFPQFGNPQEWSNLMEIMASAISKISGCSKLSTN